MIALLAILIAPAHATEPDPAALCGDRSPCRLLDTTPAGAEGAVAHLALHDQQGDAWMEPQYGGEVRCWPHEYWLLPPSGAPRLLLRLCNDGYGAAGMGSDGVSVADGALTRSQSGGSSWRWHNTETLDLATLTLRAEASSGMWTMGPNETEDAWSWADFAGTQRWFAPRCGAEEGAVPDPLPYVGQLIPRVVAPAGFADQAWRTTRLGACAASASFVAHGEPSTAADSGLRAVLLGDVLLVEVTDDDPHSGASSWLYDDHVELWLGSRRGYMDHCLEADPELKQWGIRLSDGAVFAGHGDPAPLAAEVAHDGATTRLKIALPAAPQRITVVFSDSDDGQTQERLLATSALVHADASTLGAVREIDAGDATCAVTGGALEPALTPRPPSDAPVLCCADVPATPVGGAQ